MFVIFSRNQFDFCSESDADGYRSIEILLRPMEIPGHIKSVFIQNGVKLFARLSTACLEKEDDRGLIRVSSNFIIS